MTADNCDSWDEKTQKNWKEKMLDIGKGQKLSEKELAQLRKEGKIN